jgi:hypothetical protein
MQDQNTILSRAGVDEADRLVEVDVDNAGIKVNYYLIYYTC